MPLSFPGSPSVNDTYTVGQRTWTWDGYIWSLSADTIVTSAEIAVDGVTTTKILDANVTAAKLASNSVITAKILDANVTTAKVAANAITQAKLASNLSAVTVTTTANRDTDIATPFTGQLAILTDTKKIQLYDGTSWVNVSLAPPETPTSLSATALSATSVSIAFTAGGANGSPITNYKYALSTNGGSTYGSFIAVDPADSTSPITISGLSQNTVYYIKLKAVNDMGDSVASSAVSSTTLDTPGAPTSLSAGSITTTSVAISFTPGAQGGSAISNYQYAISTDSGSTYGSFTALSPADATSPVTISGLTDTTTYYVKLKAVNTDGAGTESSALSFTTMIGIDYLVVAGGGGANSWENGTSSGGAGAGGLRSTVTNTGGGGSLETKLGINTSTNYTVTVGAGGVGDSRYGNQTAGVNSVFSTITSVGGGKGGFYGGGGASFGLGGSGGGGGDGSGTVGGLGTENQGYAGGATSLFSGYGNSSGGGGGGAGGVGIAGAGTGGAGGPGVAVSITGTSVTYAGGGGGASNGVGGSGGGGSAGSSASGSGAAGTVNTGGGGGGSFGAGSTQGVYYGGAGGSGIVVLRYSSALTITVGAGLTASHTNTVISGGYKYTRITAGTGNVSWA